MKAEITDALLAGHSVREIATWAVPPVGRMALQRFRSQHVLPALQYAVTNTKRLARSPIQKALREGLDGQDAIEAVRAEIRHAPVLAVREKRLEFLQDRHDRLNLIVEERATDMASVPGGKSGFLAKDYKSDGREVYKVDGVLLGELRELEKQTAVEIGEWQGHTSPGVMVQIVMPSVPTGEHKRVDPPCVDIALPKRS